MEQTKYEIFPVESHDLDDLQSSMDAIFNSNHELTPDKIVHIGHDNLRGYYFVTERTITVEDD